MALRIGAAGEEIRLRLHPEDAIGEHCRRALEYVRLEAFDVDLEEVGSRNYAVAQQRVEFADGHLASLRRPAAGKDW